MIINLEPIYKKIIYVLVRKNHGIRLRKAEKEAIAYDGLSVEDGYNKMINSLKEKKRIKTKNVFGRLWQRATNFWRL